MSKFFYKHEDEVTEDDLNFLGEDVAEEESKSSAKKKDSEPIKEKEEPSKKTKVVKKVRRVVSEEPKEHITIRIPTPNKRWIERIVYWVIILVLLFMVFQNPIAGWGLGESTEAPAVTGGSVDNTTSEVDSDATASDSAGESDEKKEEKDDPPDEKKEEPKKTTSTAKGDPTFAIKDIVTEKGDNDHMKITGIEVAITNGGSDFRPLVKVYAYDDNDKEYMEEFIRGEWQFDIGLKPGEKKMATVDVKPSTFYDLDLEKTFIVELYEVGNDDVIDKETEDFDLEDYD